MINLGAQMRRPVDFNHKAAEPISSAFHAHTRYEIYYFHEGKCNYVIGPQVYSLQPGDLIIMHGMTMHSPNPAPSYPYIRSMCHFEPQFLMQYMNQASMSPLLKPFEELRNYRLHTGSYRIEVENVLEEMGRLYDASNRLRYERFLLRFFDLLYIISDLCRQPMLSGYVPSSEKERHVQGVIEYIEKHFTEDISMADIERELHISKHYLARLFKEWTGTTIFNFLYNRRINQAKTLFIINDQLTVSEAAEQVGFKHLPHFSRVFRKSEGCPPDVYRKRIRMRE
jgi:AraC-like DNA-binding protein